MADSLLKYWRSMMRFKAVAMVATDAIAEAQRRHDTWVLQAAALGRTIIGTQLLASSLKATNASRFKVKGMALAEKSWPMRMAAGKCVVISRILMSASELNDKGKLDVPWGCWNKRNNYGHQRLKHEENHSLVKSAHRGWGTRNGLYVLLSSFRTN